MNNRIKEIRKNLKLNQKEFGKRLGITDSGVSNLESGRRGVTEQMIKSICREYNVDYIWLTTGEGEMFSTSDDDIMDAIDKILSNEDVFYKNLFKTFAKLGDDEIKALKKIIDTFNGIADENKKS